MPTLALTYSKAFNEIILLLVHFDYDETQTQEAYAVCKGHHVRITMLSSSL